MVTEGGLYILTLFDDFGGTYGKSDSETGKRWCSVTCHPYQIIIESQRGLVVLILQLSWISSTYFFFSTFGIINYRDVGNHLGLWIGQFLS